MIYVSISASNGKEANILTGFGGAMFVCETVYTIVCMTIVMIIIIAHDRSLLVELNNNCEQLTERTYSDNNQLF